MNLRCKEASKVPKALRKEITALEKNGTWTVIDLPTNKKAIGCKYVYKIKYYLNGTIERYKVRLVAKGYKQQESIDYQDSFCLVAKLTIMRIQLTVAAKKNRILEHLNINNSFLHGTLEEEIHMHKLP